MSELDDIQSTSTLITAPDIEAAKSPEQKSIEHDEMQKEFAVAALNQHPGWQELRAMMVKDIEDFRALRTVNMSSYNNKQLGEVVRTEHAIADRLETYLRKVDQAAKAVAHGKSK